VCGEPLLSAYTAFTASQRWMVTDDGENRYGVDPTLIVVVGPLVVHAAARVAVSFGFTDGLGVDVVGDAVPMRRVAVAVGEAVFTAVVDFVAFGVGVGVAEGVCDTDVVTGGDCESCTSTFAGPPLHAVAVSTSARAAVTFPEVRMPA
jgi:hypothetical protein